MSSSAAAAAAVRRGLLHRLRHCEQQVNVRALVPTSEEASGGAAVQPMLQRILSGTLCGRRVAAAAAAAPCGASPGGGRSGGIACASAGTCVDACWDGACVTAKCLFACAWHAHAAQHVGERRPHSSFRFCHLSARDLRGEFCMVPAARTCACAGGAAVRGGDGRAQSVGVHRVWARTGVGMQAAHAALGRCETFRKGAMRKLSFVFVFKLRW
eukprot:363216-Chlamydomonas_euryale.AAC.6